jgi:hypothetical protein
MTYPRPYPGLVAPPNAVDMDDTCRIIADKTVFAREVKRFKDLREFG